MTVAHSVPNRSQSVDDLHQAARDLLEVVVEVRSLLVDPKLLRRRLEESLQIALVVDWRSDEASLQLKENGFSLNFPPPLSNPYAVPGVVRVTAMAVGTSASPTGTVDLPAMPLGLYTLDSRDVAVTVTG